jgi:protein TonB
MRRRELNLVAALGLAVFLASCGDDDVTSPSPPCTLPIVPISAADPPFQLIGMQEPAYPDEAVEQGHQGTVVVRTIADHDGSVCETNIASSSGYAELDGAAVAAAGTARFSVAWSGGHAVRVEVMIPIEFRLHPLFGRPNTVLQPPAPRAGSR